VRQLIFDIAIHFTGRALLARDLALRRVKRRWEIGPSDHGFSRHRIPNGRYVLDAVLAIPGAGRARASVLICHGIGETVQHWFGVQQLLAANGVASLVFDYSGYGLSTGIFHAQRSEADSVAAFHFLEQQVPSLPISLLGFSLGSGIAAAILPHVDARSLVLCAAFTSMRDAAHSVGVPRFLRFGVPAIWHAEGVLRTSKVPVLIVHGERDRLFPVRMASELCAWCGALTQVIIVPELGHNEPFYRPTMAYWAPIVSHLLGLSDPLPDPLTADP
jgi:alpha-beta hydrolase superfamily lysophospholipase